MIGPWSRQARARRRRWAELTQATRDAQALLAELIPALLERGESPTGRLTEHHPPFQTPPQ